MANEDSRVRALAEPLAASADLVLVDVAVKGQDRGQDRGQGRGQGGQRLVRVTVDRKGGVSLAACQALSAALSARLDEEDPLSGSYALEVTSPGVDWPLEGRDAFDRVEGRSVLVQRSQGATVSQVRGKVVAAEADVVVLDVEGETVRVPYQHIAKAKQTLPW